MWGVRLRTIGAVCAILTTILFVTGGVLLNSSGVEEGAALGFGVAVPLFALAILRTGALPRWLGWLGLVVAVFAGWLGLLGPASDVIERISVLGSIGFFVFMLAMGIALLRRERGAATV